MINLNSDDERSKGLIQIKNIMVVLKDFYP